MQPASHARWGPRKQEDVDALPHLGRWLGLLLQAGAPGGHRCTAGGQLGLRQTPHLGQRNFHGLHSNMSELSPEALMVLQSQQ